MSEGRKLLIYIVMDPSLHARCSRTFYPLNLIRFAIRFLFDLKKLDIGKSSKQIKY